MKKLKWFTLVEILIVIVIIWILIWALVPRLQWTQWRARDVARKNDLRQIQTSILTSFQDKGEYPSNGDEEVWRVIGAVGGEESMTTLLEWAWLSSVPNDPIMDSVFYWMWKFIGERATKEWTYLYYRSLRNGVEGAWFFLMAATETEWASNRVVCNRWEGDHKWYIGPKTDSKYWKPCTTLVKVSDDRECVNDRTLEDWKIDNQLDAECKYSNVDQLRYVLAY